jgi:predicted Zn finger-like uncharacterized protein
MSIQAVCPDCQAVYTLADQQEGKKVRCKHCEAVFVATDEPPRRKTSKTGVEIVERPTRSGRAAPARSARDEEEEDVDVRRPSRRRDDDDEDDEEEDERPRSNMPWIIGGGVAGLVVLVAGAIVMVLLLRDRPAASSPVASSTAPADPVPMQPVPQQPLQQPFKQPDPQPPQVQQPVVRPQPVVQPVVDPQPPPRDPAPERPAGGGNAQLSRAAKDRVKHATVYLRVTMPDASKASGTGFFGCAEARNIILTNAHVVGMLAPDSRRPQKIEVFVNSGEANEFTLGATVLGVDRSSDLAVLDIGNPDKPLPEPLVVKAASGLSELDQVYVFGFPFGEKLGKEITIRPSSVSALRKKGGVLDKVQVNGGMDPGNSGGPVVDNSGAVVGVAVSGIPGRQINFAIPGERVHTILNGRIAALGLGQPFLQGNRIAVPVTAEMIDPRNRIKQVALEVWAGNPPANPNRAFRPASSTPPTPEPGDSQRNRVLLAYVAGQGKADVLLPELPAGKVWWQQPVYTDAAGATHWASANVVKLPSQPVERKPAQLVLRPPGHAVRPLDLVVVTSGRISSDDEDAPIFSTTTHGRFNETISAGASGVNLRLQYLDIDRKTTIGRETRATQGFEQIKADVKRLVAVLQLDTLGNLTRNEVDDRAIRPTGVVLPPRPVLPSRPGLPPRPGRPTRPGMGPRPPVGGGANNDTVERILAARRIHEPVQQGLQALCIPMPREGTVTAGAIWKAERPLPIDQPGKLESGVLDMTYTYLGQRQRDGHDEAVLNIDGIVRGNKETGAAISGKATGHAHVDVATGQITFAETKVVLDLDLTLTDDDRPGSKTVTIKVICTLLVRLERKLN